MKPSVGRLVHYRQTPHNACQAALVVKAWDNDPELVNLLLFRDGSNDRQQRAGDQHVGELVMWKTSIRHNEHPEGLANADATPSWHWPEREEEARP